MYAWLQPQCLTHAPYPGPNDCTENSPLRIHISDSQFSNVIFKILLNHAYISVMSCHQSGRREEHIPSNKDKTLIYIEHIQYTIKYRYKCGKQIHRHCLSLLSPLFLELYTYKCKSEENIRWMINCNEQKTNYARP